MKAHRAYITESKPKPEGTVTIFYPFKSKRLSGQEYDVLIDCFNKSCKSNPTLPNRK